MFEKEISPLSHSNNVLIDADHSLDQLYFRETYFEETMPTNWMFFFRKFSIGEYM